MIRQIICLFALCFLALEARIPHMEKIDEQLARIKGLQIEKNLRL